MIRIAAIAAALVTTAASAGEIENIVRTGPNEATVYAIFEPMRESHYLYVQCFAFKDGVPVEHKHTIETRMMIEPVRVAIDFWELPETGVSVECYHDFDYGPELEPVQ